MLPYADTESTAYKLGYWVGPLMFVAIGVALIIWGVFALRGSGRGVVRVVIGSLLAAVMGLGFSANLISRVADDPEPAASQPTVEASPSASPTPTATPKPRPKKFKPTPVRDPGPATVYASCSRAFDVVVATRAEVIRQAKLGDVNNAISAIVAETRLIVANGRCFKDDFVAGAKKVKLYDINRQVPPGIRWVATGCQQVVTNAYRLLGLATSAAAETEGDLDFSAGIDTLARNHRECLSDEDVTKLKAELAKELPTGS